MELFDGTLRDELDARRARDAPLALDELVDYATQVCSAVHYLHTHAETIVHRDVKSENVF
eukprot:CAMPEP_0198333228 /NCGR_PEP_ID=MMETSP1450-20131203/18821_1 /TAXON_ID=753684 ORGANISM="Madagascaria erythrocladiodes, Strain CCMP3234" /NCGR_SAMPLE_ID=MMETSP1450 /ASSEMBLY_ACC=CAM_ASM_001115 /LENGTH=59 /DNA_ID=CAMNT_0044037737 /DNA_START=1 /DNA_END=177 /DNA_ORIENTATION=+